MLRKALALSLALLSCVPRRARPPAPPVKPVGIPEGARARGTFKGRQGGFPVFGSFSLVRGGDTLAVSVRGPLGFGAQEFKIPKEGVFSLIFGFQPGDTLVPLDGDTLRVIYKKGFPAAVFSPLDTVYLEDYRELGDYIVPTRIRYKGPDGEFELRVKEVEGPEK